jgi:NitT/TauT family transport system permease protein
LAAALAARLIGMATMRNRSSLRTRPDTTGLADTGEDKSAAPAVTGRRRGLVPVLGRYRRAEIVTARLAVAVVIVLFWQFASASGFINPVFYSSPSAIVSLLAHQFTGQDVQGTGVWVQIGTTVEEVVIGYAIGAAAGVLAGFVIGRSRLLTRALEPYILTFYAVPKISIAPLFVIIFGIGLTSKVAIVFIEAFFILFYSTFRGVLQINEQLVQVAQVMGASRRAVLLRVLLPAALPSVLAGLQLAVPFAVIGAVVGEYVASSRGLGWLVLYAGSTLNAAQLFGAIVLLIIIVWLLTRIVGFCVHRMAPWLPRDSGTGQRTST